jgi:hypothetical protein
MSFPSNPEQIFASIEGGETIKLECNAPENELNNVFHRQFLKTQLSHKISGVAPEQRKFFDTKSGATIVPLPPKKRKHQTARRDSYGMTLVIMDGMGGVHPTLC